MTVLAIHPDSDPHVAEVFRDPDSIAEKLWEIGVLFERWQAEHAFSPDADQDTVIDAYRQSIRRLIDRYEFQMVDVIAMSADHPQKAELRAKFLSEHTHDDFEARFFVEGKGIFYLHANHKVYIVLCEQGDLLSVPAHTRHWFDMGATPHLKAIRLFSKPEGWIAEFTGSPIAEQFPKFEQFLASHT